MNSPKIYFLIGSSDIMSGGVKVLYKHAEILKELGYDAYVVNEKKSYIQNWFNSKVDCLYFNDLIISENDIVVVPETFAFYYLNKDELTLIKPINKFIKQILSNISIIDKIYNFKSELHKIDLLKMYDFCKKSESKILIHNQNMHYSFTNRTSKPFNIDLFSKPNVSFAYTSEYNGDYLKEVFRKDIYRLKWALNTDIFNLPKEEKKLSICYMPRKCQLQSDLVIRALQRDKELNDVEIIAIDRMHELEVAKVMKNSLFFLSFSELEGCPLPPAEAMSSGCYVIGFTGNGANEYMLPEFCDVIEKDDINSFVKQLKSRIIEAKQNKETIIEKGKKASIFIQNHLSKEEEKRLLLDLFSKIELEDK